MKRSISHLDSALRRTSQVILNSKMQIPIYAIFENSAHYDEICERIL